jgi:hypothetical protein
LRERGLPPSAIRVVDDDGVGSGVMEGVRLGVGMRVVSPDLSCDVDAVIAGNEEEKSDGGRAEALNWDGGIR